MLLSLSQFKQLLAILFPLDLILILKDKDDFFLLSHISWKRKNDNQLTQYLIDYLHCRDMSPTDS